jgi:hypothetical protein
MGKSPFDQYEDEYLNILRSTVRHARKTNEEQGFRDGIITPEQWRRVAQDPVWKLDEPLKIPERDPTNYVRLAIRGVTERAANRHPNPSEKPELYFLSVTLGGGEEFALAPYSVVEDRGGSGAQQSHIHTVDVSAAMLPVS